MSHVDQDQPSVVVRWSDDGQRTWKQKTIPVAESRRVIRALYKPGRSFWYVYPKVDGDRKVL